MITGQSIEAISQFTLIQIETVQVEGMKWEKSHHNTDLRTRISCGGGGDALCILRWSPTSSRGGAKSESPSGPNPRLGQ
jgi:hypothetical protein